MARSGLLFSGARGRAGLGLSLYLATGDDIWQLGTKLRWRRFIDRDFLHYLELAFWDGIGFSGDMDFHPGLTAHQKASRWVFLPLLAYLALGGGAL